MPDFAANHPKPLYGHVLQAANKRSQISPDGAWDGSVLVKRRWAIRALRERLQLPDESVVQRTFYVTRCNSSVLHRIINAKRSNLSFSSFRISKSEDCLDSEWVRIISPTAWIVDKWNTDSPQYMVDVKGLTVSSWIIHNRDQYSFWNISHNSTLTISGLSQDDFGGGRLFLPDMLVWWPSFGYFSLFLSDLIFCKWDDKYAKHFYSAAVRRCNRCRK
jgi:hypothetical protein